MISGKRLQASHSLNVTFYDPYMVMVISILVSSIAMFMPTTVLEMVLVALWWDVSASTFIIEFTARPTPPRNVTVQPSQTSLLIEWIEPEQIDERYGEYYVVCGTQTRYISITQTAVIITGLSVFTRYECCVTANVLWYSSIPTCLNAANAPGI